MTSGEQHGTARRRVPALERAAAILDLVSASSRPLRITDIARDLGLAKSSVHALCETLAVLDLLRADGAGYGPGARALRWSSAWLGRSTLVAEFERIVAREPGLRGYTATLSVLDGDQVIYLACRESDKPLGFAFRPGMRLPAAFTATGKAMLAALGPEDRAAALAGPWPDPYTGTSVRDLASLERQIVRWQECGHALDQGEIRSGMVCIGVAIPGPDGRPVAGIALSMTSAEATDAVLDDLGAALRDMAQRLGRG